MDIMAARLTKNLVFIKENLSDNAIDSIIDVLIQKGVIRLSDRPSFVDGKPLKEKIQSVLNEVMRKKKYDEFISALSDTNNEHVLQEITSLDDEEFAKFTEAFQEMETISYVPGTLSEAQQHIISLKTENDEVTKKFEELKRIQQKLRLDLEVKHETMKKLKSDLRMSVLEKEQIATERDKIASERDLLNDRLTQLESEIIGLRKDLDIKTVQIDTMKNHLEEIKRDLANERQHRTDDRKQHENELKEIRKQYESIMKVLNETRGKQTKKNPGYKNNNASNLRADANKLKPSYRK